MQKKKKSLRGLAVKTTNEPVVSLTPYNPSCNPKHLQAVDRAYDGLSNSSAPLPNFQANHVESYRRAVVKEAELPEYDVKNPLDLPKELRTDRWSHLCELLESFDILDPNKQLALLRVIQTLGFHNYVADIAMKIPLAEINDSTRASLALLCGQSKHLHSFDSGYTGDVTLIEHVANNAPNSKAKIAAALQLIAYYGKNQQNLNKTKYWADFALKEIELIKSQLSKFDLTRYMSVYHRAAAFVPILDGDLQEMRTEMDACRKYAQDLLNCASPSQKPVAEENHQLVLESSTKEAILLQDYDLAYQRAHELGVTLDPFDSRYKLELGQVCLLRQEYRKAAHFYHQAFLLGAPCTEIALFMEGQCYEAIGDLEAAYRCYLLCLDYDPKAISALKKVAELTPKLNAPIYKLYQSLSDEQITMFTL